MLLYLIVALIFIEGGVKVAERVGVPTVSGMKESMIGFGLGIGGGLTYAISTSLFGSGLIGGLLGAGIAGSVIKGVQGEIISTVLGFQAVMGSATSSASASAEAPQRAVI